MHTIPYHEITSIDELREMLETRERIERCAFQDMDFSELTEERHTARYFDCLFMGCTFSKQMRIQIDRSCLIFSPINVPYNCFRNEMYTAETLYDRYIAGHPESYHECLTHRIIMQSACQCLFDVSCCLSLVQVVLVHLIVEALMVTLRMPCNVSVI